MNIFVLDRDPVAAAKMYCDKHVPKMVVELYQQLGSALLSHGAKEAQMPLTQKGTPLKGGYPKHPCTLWVGQKRAHFDWACSHAQTLCSEYQMRYAKVHACQAGIVQLCQLRELIPLKTKDELDANGGDRVLDFVQVMPEEFQCKDAVAAYRAYYHSKAFARWQRGRLAPSWWQGAKEAQEAQGTQEM